MATRRPFGTIRKLILEPGPYRTVEIPDSRSMRSPRTWPSSPTTSAK